MEVKFIPCKSIDVPKVSADVRSRDREVAKDMADSIKIDGQKVPIAVRPNPEEPGRYILINGWYRLQAMKNVLKMELISARIFENMDEEEAAIARDVEQIWSNPLNAAQRVSALKRWHAHWLATLPPITPDEKPEHKPRDKRSPDGTPLPDPEPEVSESKAAELGLQSAADAPFDSTPTRPGRPPKPESHRESTFDEKSANIMGQSIQAVRIGKDLARKFSDEELEIFAQCDVTQDDMLLISRIKDKVQRTQVVSLIAGTAMKTEDAIKEVCGAEAQAVRADVEKARVEKAAKAEAAKETLEPEMDDETWFAHHCGDTAKFFRNPHKFKADAILYRHAAESRAIFRAKNKAMIKEIKKCGVTGPFWGLINRVISISHPKDWLICPQCKGTGIEDGTPEDQQVKPNCKKCFGSGYLLKTEEYQ